MRAQGRGVGEGKLMAPREGDGALATMLACAPCLLAHLPWGPFVVFVFLFMFLFFLLRGAPTSKRDASKRDKTMPACAVAPSKRGKTMLACALCPCPPRDVFLFFCFCFCLFCSRGAPAYEQA